MQRPFTTSWHSRAPDGQASWLLLTASLPLSTHWRVCAPVGSPLSGLRQPVGGRVTGSGVEHLMRHQTYNEKNLQLKCLLPCLQTCVRVILPRWAAEPRLG